MSGAFTLPPAFAGWLDKAAGGIDAGTLAASEVLPQLVAAGLAEVGVPTARGGAGGDVVDAVMAIAAVAEKSLAAAFMLWGHRSYIEYLLGTANRALAEEHLPELLSGRVAGASGLSNAMKFLAGIERLQLTAEKEGDRIRISGRLPWVTNLRKQGFHVAVAIDWKDGHRPAFVAFLDSRDEGLRRSPDLELMGMRSSDTAALTLAGVEIGPERILAEDANGWLSQMKPAFIGLQCGMSVGLARRSLTEAAGFAAAGRHVLAGPVVAAQQQLQRATSELVDGLRKGWFEADPASLFALRIELAEIVAGAVQLELQASGGRAYLAGSGAGFARRWREAAFVPLVTPSLTQMRAALLAEAEAA